MNAKTKELFYACCPYCKNVLVQAQNGMDGYIKYQKCVNIYISYL